MVIASALQPRVRVRPVLVHKFVRLPVSDHSQIGNKIRFIPKLKNEIRLQSDLSISAFLARLIMAGL